MNNIQNQFLSIEQLQDQYLKSPGKAKQASSTELKSFGDILTKKNESISQGSEIRFSKHATNRLASRQIELDNQMVARLEDGMQRASEKGIKDSLVIMDQLAFIVNIPSNTVVTAMDQTESKENIFTNIDGAVIV